MAGSGGSASSSLPAYITSAHDNILAGTAYVSPAAIEPYDTTPSVLGFLHERGLTDVGGNPYEGVSAFNADNNFQDALDRERELDTLLSNLSSWEESYTAVEAKATDVAEAVDVDSLFTAVVNAATAAAATALAAAFATAQTDSASLISATHSNAITQSGLVSDALIAKQTAIETEAQRQLTETATRASSVGDSIATAVGSRLGTMLTTGDAATLASVQALLTAATGGGGTSLTTQREGLDTETAAAYGALAAVVSPSADITAALTVAKAAAAEAVTAAASSAEALANSSIISSAIAAYRVEALKTHLRAVNAFTGGMSDINAVNSSAFVFGMALLESDYQADVNKFQAELSLRLYSEGLGRFFESLQTSLSGYFNLYQVQMQGYLQLHSANVQVLTNAVGEFIRAYLQGLTNYLNAAAQGSSSDAALFQAISSVKGQLSSVFADVQSRAFQQSLEKGVDTVFNHLAAHTGEFQTLFSPYISGSVQQALDRRALKAQFISSGTGQLLAAEAQEVELNKATEALLLESARIRSVLTAEEWDKNLEYDVRSATWDMELFQMAGNVISSSTGAVVTNVGKPTRLQSAMGGALSGASIGSAAGVPGMIAGAAAGLIGGAIM